MIATLKRIFNAANQRIVFEKNNINDVFMARFALVGLVFLPVFALLGLVFLRKELFT